MNSKLYTTITLLILTTFWLVGCTGAKAATLDPQPTSTGQTDPTPRVTLADNGKTVTFKAGQSFLLFLGEDYIWSLSISDQAVISRVKNIATIRGAQGVFNSLKAGSTTLLATGDPTCRDQQPACAQPSIQFQVTIVVQ